MDLPFLATVLFRLLDGLPILFKLAASSIALGAVLALCLAAMRMSGIAVLDWFARAYVFVFRGTPLLVQVFLIYYGTGQFPEIRQSFAWPYLRDAYFCGLLALTLNTGAYASEIIRGGLQAVPAGAVEAGRAAGMSHALLLRRIILPLAIRQALPAYSNEIILIVKATSLASTITLMEVTGLAARIRAETLRDIEVFCCAAALYLVINFTITRIMLALEYWLSPHLRDAPEAALATLALRGETTR